VQAVIRKPTIQTSRFHSSTNCLAKVTIFYKKTISFITFLSKIINFTYDYSNQAIFMQTKGLKIHPIQNSANDLATQKQTTTKANRKLSFIYPYISFFTYQSLSL